MPAVESKIVSVQVYRRGATITRHAELTAGALASAAFPCEVELAGLPLCVVDATLRVRVLRAEPADAVVTASSARVGLAVRPGDPPPAAPEVVELNAARVALQRVQQDAQALQMELDQLAAVEMPDRPEGLPGVAPPPSPMAARLQLEQFIDDSCQHRRGQLRDLNERARVFDEQIAGLNERIAAASSASLIHAGDVSKSALVRIEASGAAPTAVLLEVTYVVPGARWAPAYQCKLSRDGSKADIQMRAWVAQRSGEDWRGVALRLSTASPLSFTELPQLPALRIGRAQPAPSARGFRPAPAGADALFLDFDNGTRAASALVPKSEVRTVSPATSLASRANFSQLEMEASSHGDDGADDEGSVASFEAFEEKKSPAMKAVALRRPTLSAPSAPAPQRETSSRAGPGRVRSAVPDDVVHRLMYGMMRLPASDDVVGRGKLLIADSTTLYAQSVARFARPLGFQLTSLLAQAQRDASLIEVASLPTGCVDADDIESHFDFAYEADSPVEILGDGGFHSVPLGDRTADARMRYVAVPREEPAVFRTAVVTNPIASPLLPGPAEIYVGGEYVLTTKLPTVPARGELKLGLGVEQAIKIARNTKFNEMRSGEKVVAMTQLVHDVQIDVTNMLGRAIELEVRERIPIAALGAEVVIDEDEVVPAWTPYDQSERHQPIDGGRCWEVAIDAGATTTLRARYIVKIYANQEVVGGNRREHS